MATKYWITYERTEGSPNDSFVITLRDQFGDSIVAPTDIYGTLQVVNSGGGSVAAFTVFLIESGDATTNASLPTLGVNQVNEFDEEPSPTSYNGIPIAYYDGSAYESSGGGGGESALVINAHPGTYYSAHGDLIFTVYDSVKSADSATYPAFKYVCDVYIGATLVTRLKAVPDPETGRGVFAVGGIIRSYVESVFNPDAGSLRAQESGSGEFNITATMKFGDEVDGTITTNILVDSARTYYNHYNGRMLGTASNLSEYTDKALTVRPYQTPVNEDDDFCFIPYLPTDIDNVVLSIKAYSEAGTLLDTITQAIAPTAANTLQLYNVAPTVLNSLSAGFTYSASYYTVEFQTPNDTSDSIFRFNLTCESIYEVKTLHFLNRFGGFESKNFSKVSQKRNEITKSEFGKKAYRITSTGTVEHYNSNNVYNETRSVYASRYEEKLKLNSDLLTDDEYIWLADLVNSPLVYLEDDGFFIPVVISQSNYDFRKRQTDKLTNLTLEIEFGEKFNTQYR